MVGSKARQNPLRSSEDVSGIRKARRKSRIFSACLHSPYRSGTSLIGPGKKVRLHICQHSCQLTVLYRHLWYRVFLIPQYPLQNLYRYMSVHHFPKQPCTAQETTPQFCKCSCCQKSFLFQSLISHRSFFLNCSNVNIFLGHAAAMRGSKDIRRICLCRRQYPDEPDIFFLQRPHFGGHFSRFLRNSAPGRIGISAKPLPWDRETGRKTFPVYTFPTMISTRSTIPTRYLLFGSRPAVSMEKHPTGWFP